MRNLLIYALFVVMTSCHQNEVVNCTIHPCPEDQVNGPMEDEKSDAALSPAGRACSNLRTLQCEDGFARKGERSCTENMGIASRSAIVEVPLDCLAKAKSKKEARACGYVRCPD